MKTLRSKIIAVLIVLVIAAAAYTVGSGTFFTPRTASADPILYNEDTVTSIYNNASPAVVEIDVTQQGTASRMFGGYVEQGQGSGFLIDTQGHILTNNHVVSGATTVQVKLKNGNTVNAKVVGTDTIDDLAVISVDTSAVSGITPLTLGDSNAVKPGQMAIAIGNPYGYDNTVTVGVISGINRTISGSNYTGMLQTDAAINPGNSGGPLLNANGAVIGINTAIESTSTGARGIGFAVTSNTATKALPNLEAGQQVTRPWIGISGTSVTQANAQSLGLSVNQGVYVVSVVAGSPAATAGLKGSNIGTNGQPVAGGDVITSIDGNAVKTIDDLTSYINTKNVGNTVTLSILRGGNTISVQVTLATRPANINTGVTPNIPAPNQQPNQQTPRFPGRGNGRYYYQTPTPTPAQ
jgi:S1-C subfamily serine protease